MDGVGPRPPLIDYLQRWADLEARPRILVGDDLDLLWANTSAHDVFRKAVDIRLSDGRVEMTNPAEQDALRRFVIAALPTVGAWCSSQADGAVLLFRSWRLDGFETGAVGLVFHTTGGEYAPRWADFGRALGLTAAEYRVALRLLDGVRIEVVAKDMGITPATARTHVRNLYQKLSIGSREALFRLLAPFRIS